MIDTYIDVQRERARGERGTGGVADTFKYI
jgi:hypothetical protein